MSFTDNFGNPKGLLGRMMLVTMEREHLPMAKWAFPQLDIPDTGDILDIGCGGGYNIKRLLEASAGANVAGIDISEESVRKARKINKTEFGKRCSIYKGSVGSLPFDDESFDLITAFETVFFWPDLKSNLHEVLRVVKPEGSFAIINNYGDPNIDWEKKVPCMKRYTAEQIQEFMASAGFRETTVAKKDNLFLVTGRKRVREA
ncbi:MAG: class I SAM-dependent methyltransferase [Lachnospiraceae bacterium]|nr:class I SAM-dependent methyltransferase [Lachnospiraceae bacterium]